MSAPLPPVTEGGCVNYHLMYIDDRENFPTWKYYGHWAGDTPLAAIVKSKIDGSVALTAIRLYEVSSGLEYVRSGWEPKSEDE